MVDGSKSIRFHDDQLKNDEYAGQNGVNLQFHKIKGFSKILYAIFF